MILLEAFGVWILLIFVAIANGIMREALYGKLVVSELAAHKISTVVLVMVLLLIFFFFLRSREGHLTDLDLALIGGMYLGLTIAFEFVFGHYVMGHPWSRLLADYNILRGRVWSLVLLTNAVGPYVVGRYLV
jgi:membrane protease YdiL (CAAX protease family)